jgi:hypothetical protein
MSFDLEPHSAQSSQGETHSGADSSEQQCKYESSLLALALPVGFPPEAAPPLSTIDIVALFQTEAAAVTAIYRTLLVSGRMMLTEIFRAGEVLSKVKEGLPHGSWMLWTAANLPHIHHRTLRYMQAYRRRNDPLAQSDPARLLNEIYGNAGSEEPANSTSTSNLSESPTPVEELVNSTSASDLPSGSAPRSRKVRQASRKTKPDPIREFALVEASDLSEELQHLAVNCRELLKQLPGTPLSEKMRTQLAEGLSGMAKRLESFAFICADARARFEQELSKRWNLILSGTAGKTLPRCRLSLDDEGPENE